MEEGEVLECDKRNHTLKIKIDPAFLPSKMQPLLDEEEEADEYSLEEVSDLLEANRAGLSDVRLIARKQ